MQIRAARIEEVLDASMYLGFFVEAVGFIRIFLLIINLILFANKLKQADELRELERKTLDAFKIVWFASLLYRWNKKGSAAKKIIFSLASQPSWVANSILTQRTPKLKDGILFLKSTKV